MALSVALHHPAAALAAALARCPEAVCRRYLPYGRRQGRYWVAGDLHGAKGRSLFVRLRPPGAPGRWTDAATGEHGDLLDLIRHRIGAGTLRPALDEARAFLALPVVQCRDPKADRAHPPAAWNGTAAARRLWRRCRVIGGTHAERYLCARGLEARAFAQGISATVLTPEHRDFNDDLAVLGPQALAARLAPLLGSGP